MKIYNKKGFKWGLFWSLIALFTLIHSFIYRDFNVKSIISSSILLLISVTQFWRSLLKTASYEDLIENNDERNQIIEFKAKSKAFKIMWLINYVIIIFSAILFTKTKSDISIGFFILPCFYLFIMLIVETVTELYYEKHE